MNFSDCAAHFWLFRYKNYQTQAGCHSHMSHSHHPSQPGHSIHLSPLWRTQHSHFGWWSFSFSPSFHQKAVQWISFIRFLPRDALHALRGTVSRTSVRPSVCPIGAGTVWKVTKWHGKLQGVWEALLQLRCRTVGQFRSIFLLFSLLLLAYCVPIFCTKITASLIT